MMNLWLEFESGETAEAKFAHTMDNIQPAMLNDATDGKAWVEHIVHLHSILNRNKILPTAQKSCGNIQGITLLCPMLKRAE